MPHAVPLSVISTFAITSPPSPFPRSSSPAPTTSPLPPPTVVSLRKIFPAHNTSNSAPRIFPTLKPRRNSLPLSKIFSLREENKMDDREHHQQGMKIRREVLGNDHVDRATQSATDFTAP